MVIHVDHYQSAWIILIIILISVPSFLSAWHYYHYSNFFQCLNLCLQFQPEGVADVGHGDDLILSVGVEPHDAAVYDGEPDVLEHQGIEAELNGVEAEVLLYHVAERR